MRATRKVCAQLCSSPAIVSLALFCWLGWRLLGSLDYGLGQQCHLVTFSIEDALAKT